MATNSLLASHDYITSCCNQCTFRVFQGLIFVVDSNDRERVHEAQEELAKMVSPEAVAFCLEHFHVVSLWNC